MENIVPYDSIVIGAGPAGITAAIYLSRKKLDILVIALDLGGQANLSTDVDNYTGFAMISGRELVKKFEEHLKAFKIKVVRDKVVAIKKDGDLFEIKTNRNTYWSKTAIIASGKKPRSLNAPGEDAFVGKGVTYYNIYDAPFFKSKPVAIVGGGNSALQAILMLAKFTKKIYVINITPELTGDEALQEKFKKLAFVKVFNNSKVTKLIGKKKLEKVEFMNVNTKQVSSLDVRGVIVEIGLEPSLGFELPEKLKMSERGEIDVDQNCNTSVAGLFAAGDVEDVKGKQIIIAAGEGAKAALSAYDYIQTSSVEKS